MWCVCVCVCACVCVYSEHYIVVYNSWIQPYQMESVWVTSQKAQLYMMSLVQTTLISHVTSSQRGSAYAMYLAIIIHSHFWYSLLTHAAC